ncbi:MAG: thioesterase family protein [Phycisphaeraceae bacterium]
MPSAVDPIPPPAPRTAAVTVRVRYNECDPMGIAHHASYPIWLEIARTELLRARGMAYRELEAAGVHFVVARMSLRYRRAARYDDELTVHVRVEKSAGIKIVHAYRIERAGELLATAETTLACVDGAGRPRGVPASLLDG